MSALTITLYIVTFGLWWSLIRREGGIGIGFRFLYALNVTLFFLIGPVLEEAIGGTQRPSGLSRLEPAVCLSLYALLAYLVGSYVAYPLLSNRSRLIPRRFLDQMADSGRLDAQRRTAWVLIGIGFASLPLNSVLFEIPTVRALWSQMNWFVDTGLVMLGLYAVHGRQFQVLGVILAILLGKGLVFSAISGHAGHVFLNGMFMACLSLLSTRFSLSRLIVLAVAAGIALYPVKMWLEGRGQLRTAIRQGSAIEERIGIVIDIFSSPRPPTMAKDYAAVYRSRGDYSELLAAALEHTPAVQPYALGESYLNVFIAIIPRFLWPDKPFRAGGNEVVTRYTGIRFDRHTSIGTNYLFELYVNFGTLGVVIGMFILGLLLAWMESLYYRKAPENLFYEYCLISCAWGICIYCDKLAEVVMTVPPIVAVCLAVHMLLRSQIYSRYLPSISVGSMRF